MRVARLVALLAVLWSAPVRADSGSFGLGLIVGQPTGLTAAFELSEKTAIDAALGLSIFDGRDFYLHVEFLYYLPTLLNENAFDLNAYLGIGGWFVAAGDAVIGARAPFGLSLDFNNAPIQIFAELSVLLAVAPDAKGSIRGAAGFRYYF
jgi:hypothetical protein